jgi:hypothetical protein
VCVLLNAPPSMCCTFAPAGDEWVEGWVEGRVGTKGAFFTGQEALLERAGFLSECRCPITLAYHYVVHAIDVHNVQQGCMRVPDALHHRRVRVQVGLARRGQDGGGCHFGCGGRGGYVGCGCMHAHAGAGSGGVGSTVTHDGKNKT